MQAPIAVLITLVVYQGVLLGLGYWARNRSQTTEGYFIGGRNLGPWVTALSYAAGSSSAWSILGVSGIAFSQGVSSFWLVPGTLTDMLAFGMQGRAASLTYRISAVVILFSFTFYIAAQFQGAANTFTAAFGFDFLTALLLPIAAFIAVDGWAGLRAAASAVDEPYWSWLGGHGGWFGLGFMLGTLSIGFGPLGQPHLLNRLMAMKSGKDIKLARTVALSWFVLVLCGMYLLGVCAHVLLTIQVEPEQVFFVMADRLLPAVFTGVLIAGVLSAIMSTADSQLLVAGAAIHHDLQRAKGVAPDATKGSAQGAVKNAARFAVFAVALAAVLLAWLLPESIFSRVLFAWNALGAAFGPVVVARLLGWRLKSWSVPTAICTGFLLTVVFYSLPDGPGDLWERGVPFLVAIVTLFLGRASSR